LRAVHYIIIIIYRSIYYINTKVQNIKSININILIKNQLCSVTIIPNHHLLHVDVFCRYDGFTKGVSSHTKTKYEYTSYLISINTYMYLIFICIITLSITGFIAYQCLTETKEFMHRIYYIQMSFYDIIHIKNV